MMIIIIKQNKKIIIKKTSFVKLLSKYNKIQKQFLKSEKKENKLA